MRLQGKRVPAEQAAREDMDSQCRIIPLDNIYASNVSIRHGLSKLLSQPPDLSTIWSIRIASAP